MKPRARDQAPLIRGELRRRGPVHGAAPRAALTLCGALLAIGCFHSSVRSGAPPGEPAPDLDEHWHHSLFWGLWEVSGPYSLNAACPEGWAEVESHVGVAQGALSLVTAGIYVPQTISVICVAPDMRHSAAPPPRSGFDRRRSTSADVPSTKPGTKPTAAPSVEPYPAAVPTSRTDPPDR